MAITPCEFCMRRYNGKASFFYATVARGTATDRLRLRLCPSCSERLEAVFDERLSRVSDESIREPSPPNCARCSDPATGESSGAVFCTAFLPDRADWYARLCTTHATEPPDRLLAVLVERSGELQPRLPGL